MSDDDPIKLLNDVLGDYDDDVDYSVKPDVELPDGYTLVRTCWACPEQYDLNDPDGVNIGYFRLRHGYYAVQVPNAAGELFRSDSTVVYEHSVGDSWSGIFTDEERKPQLQAGVDAVLRHFGVEG